MIFTIFCRIIYTSVWTKNLYAIFTMDLSIKLKVSNWLSESLRFIFPKIKTLILAVKCLSLWKSSIKVSFYFETGSKYLLSWKIQIDYFSSFSSWIFENFPFFWMFYDLKALLEYWVQKIVFQCSFFLEELRVGAAAASGSQRGKITTKETCDLVFLWHFYTLCHDDSLRSKIASLQVFCNKGYHVIVTAE